MCVSVCLGSFTVMSPGFAARFETLSKETTPDAQVNTQEKAKVLYRHFNINQPETKAIQFMPNRRK